MSLLATEATTLKSGISLVNTSSLDQLQDDSTKISVITRTRIKLSTTIKYGNFHD